RLRAAGCTEWPPPVIKRRNAAAQYPQGMDRAERQWFTEPVAEVVESLTTDLATGLTDDEVTRRTAEFGANVLPVAPVPTAWQIAAKQWLTPMNIMLTVVAAVSFLIGQ